MTTYVARDIHMYQRSKVINYYYMITNHGLNLCNYTTFPHHYTLDYDYKSDSLISSEINQIISSYAANINYCATSYSILHTTHDPHPIPPHPTPPHPATHPLL